MEVVVIYVGTGVPSRFAVANDSMFAFPMRKRTCLSSEGWNNRIRATGSTMVGYSRRKFSSSTGKSQVFVHQFTHVRRPLAKAVQLRNDRWIWRKTLARHLDMHHHA